jgi:6-phosphogluconate dehydrogenase
MQIGMIGLGRMGMNMARRLLQGGHQVAAYNRGQDKVKIIAAEGAEGFSTVEEMVSHLQHPKAVWLMLPAGKVVDDHLNQLRPLLSAGDIVIEGGNTYYRDDIRRATFLASGGVHYMDVGVSGGIWGLKIGYCMMAGGDRKIFNHLEPLFRTLAPENGYQYCGETGAGHFVKMVHNGIEYGMMQAYGEGFALLEASPYNGGLDFSKLAGLWNHGSVIRSWLLELLERAFAEDPRLETIKGYVEDSGEGRWSVQEAVDLGVSVPSLAISLFQRFSSRKEDAFENRILAALRREFGGHAVVKEKK